MLECNPDIRLFCVYVLNAGLNYCFVTPKRVIEILEHKYTSLINSAATMKNLPTKAF